MVHGVSPRKSQEAKPGAGKEMHPTTLKLESMCNQRLCSEVKQLREEHQKTLKVLEMLYENQKALKETTLTLVSHTFSPKKEPLSENTVPCPQVSPSPPVSPSPLSSVSPSQSNASCSSSLEEEADSTAGSVDHVESSVSESDEHSNPFIDDTHSLSEGPVIVPSSSPSVLSDLLFQDESVDSADDAFVPHGVEIIGSMWEEFSVDTYVPPRSFVSKKNDQCPAPRRSWSPSITIPKPFSMTIREEQKGAKKSKTVEEAERKKLEHEALENAELCKHFRANPVPATTFLPLYDLITARNEERQHEVKINSIKLLKSQERPFTFMAREEEKRKLREEERKCQEQTEVNTLRKSRQFKAQPVPKLVFDKNVDEKMKETEEYRPIRVKLRAMELLAESHLPGDMQVRRRVGHLRQQRREESDKHACLSGDHMFQPAINHTVPNHDRAYMQFENQLFERKQQQSVTTMPEPFNLRINQRIKERMENREDGEEDEVTHQSPVKVTPPPPHTIAPVSTTKSTELRHKAIQEKISNRVEEEELRELAEEERRERNRELKKAVSMKSMESDLSGWLKARQRENLHKFRYTIILCMQ